MFGASIGNLTVQLDQRTVWTRTGAQQGTTDVWFPSVIPLESSVRQIRFCAFRGRGVSGDTQSGSPRFGRLSPVISPPQTSEATGAA
eukprot:m.12796 g.12796  ORF g.12796 m.12796 type:complete len:87 (-) comp4585_c0_seq1:2592-2852(-)